MPTRTCIALLSIAAAVPVTVQSATRTTSFAVSVNVISHCMTTVPPIISGSRRTLSIGCSPGTPYRVVFAPRNGTDASAPFRMNSIVLAGTMDGSTRTLTIEGDSRDANGIAALIYY